MKDQQKKDQSQVSAPDPRQQQGGTQNKPSHMNQGTQAFRPDKQKTQETGKMQNRSVVKHP